MARGRRSKSIKVIARQRVEDGVWGIPESPEFSSVQRLMNEIQSQTARESADPLIRFLLGLIVADEERHHELTGRMISKLKDELSSSRPAARPSGEGENREKADSLLRSVGIFIEAERSAIQEYEKLKQESAGLARDVFTLLYTTMIHDSHKHLGILEFLRDRLIQNRKPSKTK